MNKHWLWVCALAALVMVWSAMPLPPSLDTSTEAATSALETEQGGIRCEVKCANNEGNGLLLCVEPTFKECCELAELICDDAGGLEWAGCYDDQIGVGCETVLN